MMNVRNNASAHDAAGDCRRSARHGLTFPLRARRGAAAASASACACWPRRRTTRVMAQDGGAEVVRDNLAGPAPERGGGGRRKDRESAWDGGVSSVTRSARGGGRGASRAALVSLSLWSRRGAGEAACGARGATASLRNAATRATRLRTARARPHAAVSTQHAPSARPARARAAGARGGGSGRPHGQRIGSGGAAARCRGATGPACSRPSRDHAPAALRVRARGAPAR
jgi:hypothetical protein